MTTAASLPTRDEITTRYRQCITQGDRKKLTRTDRDTLIQLLLDRLIEMNQQQADTEEAIEALCTAEVDLLKEGYPLTSLDSQYLPSYCTAIEAAIHQGRITLTEQNSFIKHWRKRNTPEVSGQTQTHYALEYLKLDPETYAQHRAQTNAHNNDRQDNPGNVELDPYLEKVEQLAHSEQPEEMAIAIAAITGRRHVEVVAQGHFELSQSQHRYLLHFDGQAKKRNDQTPEGFDILTLIPATDAINLIERFRSHPDIVPLIGLDDEHPDVQKFHSKVNYRCHKLLGMTGLVPVLKGFSKVSIHRLRALWGAIAFHFFAPGQKNPQRFLQHYLGHVLDTTQSAANAPVTGHYFHYRLWRNEKELTAKGVKLPGSGMLPEALPAAAEEPVGATTTTTDSTDSVEAIELTLAPTPAPRTKPARTKSIPVNLDALKTVADLLGVEVRRSKQYGYEMALDQVLTAIAQGQQVTPEPEPETTHALTQQAAALEFLTQEVKTLRGQVERLQRDRDQALAHLDSVQSATPELEALRAENTRLKNAQTSLMQAYQQLLSTGQAQAQVIERDTTEQSIPPTIAPSTPAADKTPSPAPTPTQSQPAPTPTRSSTRAPGRAMTRAAAILLAIKAWNQVRPDESFAITPGLLTSAFGINAAAAKEFVAAQQAELDDYHQAIRITNVKSHNRQLGRDVEQLKAFVQQFNQENS